MTMDIGRKLAVLEKRLERMERASRLSHASLDDTALEVRDDTGGLRAIVGQQEDGTTAVNVVNGPTPPTPVNPAVEPALAALTITWDGQFADAIAAPLDWMRIEVHIGPTGDFTPSQGTLRDTIETPQGGTVTIPLPYTEWWVRLRSRSTSGVAGPASTAVSATPRQAAAPDIQAGAVTADSLAADAITGKIITGGEVNGAIVTGATIRTGASGQRVVVLPANTEGTPAVQLYSGGAQETSPGEMVGAVSPGGTPRPYVSLLAPTIDADTTTSASLYLYSGGGTGNDQGEFKVSTGAGSGGVSSVYAYASDGSGLNAGQITAQIYEPIGSKTSALTLTSDDLFLDLDGPYVYFDATGLYHTGVLHAANIETGSVSITPTAANTPTSVAVTGLNVAGSSFRAFTTANSSVPGTIMLGTGATGISGGGLTVWLTRTNTTPTTVWWMLIGE